MGFIFNVPSASTPNTGYSLPDAVSFVVADTGSGGDMYINCLGMNGSPVSGSVDLPSAFGHAWRSIPFAHAFRALTPTASDQAATDQLVRELIVTLTPLNAGATANLPWVGYLGTLSGNIPFLHLAGPGAVGAWRVDLRMVHSLTD